MKWLFDKSIVRLLGKVWHTILITIIFIAMRTLPEKTIWSFGSIHNIFAYRTISNYRLSVISNIIIIWFVIIGVFTFFVIAKKEFCLCCFAVTFYKITIMTMRTFNWRFTFRIRRELMMFCIINIFILSLPEKMLYHIFLLQLPPIYIP